MNDNPSLLNLNTPNFRHTQGSITIFLTVWKNIWSSRFLIQQLFIRDFLAGYKKSFLGIAWVLIAPIVGIVTWVFLQKAGMLNPGELDIPYPAYVLMGTLSWDFFAGSMGAASITLKSGKALVMQVSYPHEALLVKELVQFLANYLLKFCLALVVLILFGVYPSWKIILLPLVMLPALMLGSGLGLFISLLEVVTNDIRRIFGMGMKFVMWSTPIIYGGSNIHPVLKTVNDYNPLTYIVCSIRDVVLYGKIYGDMQFYYFFIAAFVFFLIALKVFYISEQQLVERMI